MKLIAIETSTEICGIAYIENGICKKSVEKKIPRQHAEQLPLYYNQLIEQTKLKLSEIDAICVSIGPGSFTGLRIGLSYAKGLAYSHQKPIIPVPTLQSLVYGFGQNNCDAVIVYSHGNKYFFQQINLSYEEVIFDEIQVLELNGIEDIQSIADIKTIIHYGCDNLFVNEKNIDIIKMIPSPKWIGELAHKNYAKWIVQNPYKLVPEYVSPFKVG